MRGRSRGAIGGAARPFAGRDAGPTEAGDPTEGEEVVGREEREEIRDYGLIECAGLGHAPGRSGRAVAARPSILWWLMVSHRLRG
jgi:hypothetical protein